MTIDQRWSLRGASLMAFHPWPYEDYPSELVPVAGWWVVLHVAQFGLFALAGAAVWLLTSA